ncbi:NAD(P)H-dependent glycerol-3-phosphate dehydrogenase [Methylovirgula sp. 4M-Z18]|uniref:NAD(P)H-dependent glycerol-3-phosphate dehydrogenase n=1 Tax=Methylovirgula sp. 4M-Z18 TaxID=2293567 RepID=UPI000E2E73AD|nr:NAD(P)H-dependent glycerol-3-phosphate dehydrogenase [Methylovirgula sp. 4M-Z18]RFB78206.1 NAD(P)-dependent glycerol-3-phosphate dehydrogenase [Methylovirgula sp. 4M-Z18]
MAATADSNCIAIAGPGAWGIALANALARGGRRVLLWGRDPQAIAAMQKTRASAHLPGVILHETVTPTPELGALAEAGTVLIVVPAQNLREVALKLAPVLRAGVPVVSCAKGIERGSGLMMNEVLAQCLGANPPAVLSGPSFANDVARGLPTAVTLAAKDAGRAKALAATLSAPGFRLYHSVDVIGVEIGGAAKNVLAIAAGIVAGRQLGESAKAALITRGFAELARLGRALGGRTETLMGLSGLGDLILTCGTAQSRNYSLGLALGRGADVAQAAGAKLAEGAYTASVLVELAHAHKIEMPIAASVDAVLAGRLSIDAAMEALLARPQRAEA